MPQTSVPETASPIGPAWFRFDADQYRPASRRAAAEYARSFAFEAQDIRHDGVGLLTLDDEIGHLVVVRSKKRVQCECRGRFPLCDCGKVWSDFCRPRRLRFDRVALAAPSLRQSTPR